jgi:sulfonate transport system substrate-binding protein
MIMKKKLLSLLLVTALGASVLAGCGSNSSSSSESNSNEVASNNAVEGISATEVNIAIQPSGAFIPLYIAKENGWIEDALAEYGVEVNWTSFESGPPINESLAAGSSDIGVLGDVPTVSGIAAGQDNVVFQTTAEGTRAYAILIPADSSVSSVAELKGKTIATVVGSTGHNLFEKALSKEGLDVSKDVNLVNISAGDAATVLGTGEADAVAIWEPNVTRLTESGVAKVLTYGGDVDLLGVNVIVANRAFAEANPLILQIITEQYERGIDAISSLDGDVLDSIGEYLSLDNDQVLTVAGNWDYKTSIDDEDVAGLQDTIDFLVKIGNLTESYDIEDYIYKQ